MSKLVIDFKRDDDIMVPAPWPIGLDDNNVVTSGLGHDDGAVLIGFAIEGEQTVVFFADQIADIDWEQDSLVPVFSKDNKFFNWNIPVRGIRKIEEQTVVTDMHFIIDIQMSNEAMLTGFDISAALEKVRGQVWHDDLAHSGAVRRGERGRHRVRTG